MQIATCHCEHCAAIYSRGIVAVGLLLTIVSMTQAKYGGGTGEPNDPYQIATAADLIALGETPADYDKHFVLTADIDLDPNLPGRKVFDKAVIAPTPSWEGGTPFTGVFDGKGHTISHLTVKGEDCLGLFGYIEGAAEVRTLGVAGVDITGSGEWVGGLVGYNHGSVIDCYSTGAVTGGYAVGGLVGTNVSSPEDWPGSLSNCYSTCVVSGGSEVGGLVGNNEGSVTECYSTGAVGGTDYVGGLVGSNGHEEFGCCWLPGRISNCYSTGRANGTQYVGGLVGYNETGFLSHCYSSGVVRGTSDVGGLVGCAGCVWCVVSVTACFWDIETSGQAASAGGTGKTTAEMQTAKSFLDAGWDFVGETANGSEEIWKITEGLGYPRLSWEKYSGGTGEPDDPYQIATAADLIALGETRDDYDKHYILTADIDLNPNLPGRKVFDKAVIAPDVNDIESGFQGIPFTGVFDGNGRTISHLTISGDSDLGLFGELGDAPWPEVAEVMNVRMVGVSIAGSGRCVGGLAGENEGNVTRCCSTGMVSGGSHVGGLLGSNCSTGSLAGRVTRCYSSAAVTGDEWIGGLLGGTAGGTITNCYSMATVSGRDGVGGLMGLVQVSYTFGPYSYLPSPFPAHISQCYSAGVVTGENGVGGLVGCNPAENMYYPDMPSVGDIEQCFWDTQTSGQTTSDGGTGKTTAEMQTAKTFLDAGWDFAGETANGTEDIWWIDEGKDYPCLSWEPEETQRLPVMELDAASFDAQIAEGVILVDFFATWCPHCTQQAPILEEVADRLQGRARVAKLDVDKAGSITQRYGVSAIPTLIVFRKGLEARRFVGVTSADVLLSAVLAAVDSL